MTSLEKGRSLFINNVEVMQSDYAKSKLKLGLDIMAGGSILGGDHRIRL